MATVSSGSKTERFGFIERHGEVLGVRYLCEWLDVSPSGFYKWRERGESKREKSDRELLEKITRIFVDSDTTYGSPRVFEQLRQEGERVGRSRVERLMREAGLVGKAARIYRRKAATRSAYMKLPNLRIDKPAPTAVNQQWVGDITYIKVKGKWCYLAVVMDLYSRKIVGWSLEDYKTAELTLSALRKALKVRDVETGLIFHTDRGSEYGAYLMQNELKRRGILSSMNRPSSVTDNAHMESFFRSMKTECIHGYSFKDESDLRITLSHYMHDFYNKRRLHSGISYQSPIDYEQRAA
ncbi:MAG: IS3 family transposase [Gammaproteobacteria bacterium]|nr:IS3 family transposase [Gammaproteobacteria bacterium]